MAPLATNAVGLFARLKLDYVGRAWHRGSLRLEPCQITFSALTFTLPAETYDVQVESDAPDDYLFTGQYSLGILFGNGMAIGKGKSDAGQGGRLGRSNMAYWDTNAETKAEARKRRRKAADAAVK